MSQTRISFGKVVTFYYSVRTEAGKVVGGTAYGKPASYLHGAGNLFPSLEEALAGKVPGDKMQVVLAPEDAYGAQDPALIRRVPASALPPEVSPKVGSVYSVQGANGRAVQVWIRGVEGEEVILDRNHPLAGQTLHFDVTIADVRDATNDELAHGHPHDEGGHH